MGEGINTSKEEFVRILKECDWTDKAIELIWDFKGKQWYGNAENLRVVGMSQYYKDSFIKAKTLEHGEE